MSFVIQNMMDNPLNNNRKPKLNQLVIISENEEENKFNQSFEQ